MATVNNFNDRKDPEQMIKIFRRECEEEGILNELKKRKYFTKPSRARHLENKKLKHKAKLNARNNS